MFKIRLACFVMLAAVLNLAVVPLTAAAQERGQAARGTLPVTGSGTTADGKAVTFEAAMAVQRFQVEGGTLHVMGRLTKGVVKDAAGAVLAEVPDQQVNREVKSINGKALPTGRAATNDEGMAMMPLAQVGGCDILALDLGPLHLDLLGLVVDLNEVILTITGQTGAGNLLGNLLCGIFGLLDTPGTLGVIADLLNSILDLINIIGG